MEEKIYPEKKNEERWSCTVKDEADAILVYKLRRVRFVDVAADTCYYPTTD